MSFRRPWLCVCFVLLLACCWTLPLFAEDAPTASQDEPAASQSELSDDAKPSPNAPQELTDTAEEAPAEVGTEASATQEQAPQDELERVRGMLAEALDSLGLQSQESRDEVALRLEQVANESAALAGKLAEPRAKLEARNLEMQAYNALARQAQEQDQAAAASYRIGQMRSAAFDVKEIKAPGAGMIGDFWLLQADLFDLNRAVKDDSPRQRRAVERLERFVREQELAQSREPADAGSAQLLTEVKLSLLRLYDQRGESAKAVDIVQNLRASEDTPDAVMAHLDEWYSYLDLIGQPFEAKLQTTDGKMWHSAEHRGKVVLLCFLASWFKPSRLETEAVITRSEPLRRRGLGILLVDLSGVRSSGEDGAPELLSNPDIPTYRQGPGQVSLQRMFSVRSLPRFVLIDAQGRVTSVAGSSEVLEQIEPLLQAVTPPVAAPEP